MVEVHLGQPSPLISHSNEQFRSSVSGYLKREREPLAALIFLLELAVEGIIIPSVLAIQPRALNAAQPPLGSSTGAFGACHHLKENHACTTPDAPVAAVVHDRETTKEASSYKSRPVAAPLIVST